MTASAAAGRQSASASATQRSGHKPTMRLVAAGDDATTQHGTARLESLLDPRPLIHRLAQAIAEVLAGARPASQLSSHTTLQVIRQLERWAGRHGARAGTPQPGPIIRPMIGSVHLNEPCEGVIEACAVIIAGSRARALALRLEAVRGQWCCTAVNVG
jgi:hypothetical protein